ncbi:MAG: alpha/beta hydrolase, partial [Thermoleophilaceae bacterium]
MRRTALFILVALVFVALVNPLAALQRSFLYFPLAQEPPPVAGLLPEAEDVAFTTADGVRLRGWFRPGPPGALTVVVFNGNAGDRSHR